LWDCYVMKRVLAVVVVESKVFVIVVVELMC
jgi:hypothetical protein